MDGGAACGCGGAGGSGSGGCGCSKGVETPAPATGSPTVGPPLSPAVDGCPCKDGTPESPLPPTTAPAAGAPGTKPAISVTAAGSPPGASPPAKRVLVAATVTLTTSAVTALPAVKMASNTVVVTLLLTAFSVTPQALVVLQGSSDLENWSTRATWNVNALGAHALSPPASGVSPTYVRLALQGPGAGLVILEDVCFWISTL